MSLLVVAHSYTTIYNNICKKVWTKQEKCFRVNDTTKCKSLKIKFRCDCIFYKLSSVSCIKIGENFIYFFPYPKHFSGAIFSWLSFNIFSTQHLTSSCIYVFQNDEQTRHPSWDAELGSYDQGWSYLKIGSSARSRGRFSLNRVKLFLLLTCRSAILHQTQRKRVENENLTCVVMVNYLNFRSR